MHKESMENGSFLLKQGVRPSGLYYSLQKEDMQKILQEYIQQKTGIEMSLRVFGESGVISVEWCDPDQEEVRKLQKFCLQTSSHALQFDAGLELVNLGMVLAEVFETEQNLLHYSYEDQDTDYPECLIYVMEGKPKEEVEKYYVSLVFHNHKRDLSVESIVFDTKEEALRAAEVGLSLYGADEYVIKTTYCSC